MSQENDDGAGDAPKGWVAVYARIPADLDARLEAWVAEMNRELRVAGFANQGQLKVSKTVGIKILIEKGIEAMLEERAAAAREAKELEKAERAAKRTRRSR